MVFGRIHMLDFGSDRPTHPCTKFSCSNPSMYQFFCSKPIKLPILFSFYCQTHPCTKNSSSKPIHVPNFRDFLENDPPICVHQPFKTHPCTKISRFWGKMTHPCTYIFVSKPIHVPRAYVGDLQIIGTAVPSATFLKIAILFYP